MAPYIKVLMKICYPICKPIAMSLDYFLGIHGDHHFTKTELKALISIHRRNEHNKHGLTSHEVEVKWFISYKNSMVDSYVLNILDYLVDNRLKRSESTWYYDQYWRRGYDPLW